MRSRGTRGSLAAHAQDHLDLGIGLQGLGHAAAPEGVQPGDQDPSTHGSAEPDASPRPQHVVDRVLEQRAGCCSASSITAVLEYRVQIGFHVEGDGVEHPDLDLDREVGHVAQDGAEDQRLAVTGK